MIVIFLNLLLILNALIQTITILCLAIAEVSYNYSILLIAILSVPPCNLQPSLDYLDYHSVSNGYTISYQVGMCFNYTIGDLCTSGVTNDTANLICRNNGFSKWPEITVEMFYVLIFNNYYYD